MLKKKLKKLIAVGAIAATVASVVGASSVSAAGNGTKYTGNPITPSINLYDDTTNPATLLIEGTDYTLDWKDNINVGTGYIIVTYMGNYDGTKEIPFQIYARTLTQKDIVISPVADETYTGVPIEPKPSITWGDRTLENGVDYDIIYSDNKNVGTATGTVNFKGNFDGNSEFKFDITKKALSQSDVDILPIDDITYTGSPINPEPVIKYGDRTLVKDTDYTLDYDNNTNIGTGNINITFIGNYDGEASATFKIVGTTLTADDVEITDIPEQIFNNKEITPEPTITYEGKTLVRDVDYTLDYENNRNVGTGIVNVTFVGNYSGHASTTFVIKALAVTDDMVEIGNIPTQKYTGKEITPSPVVKVKIFN